MGAMVEHGIAKRYLDEHCADGNYQLCQYKDSLPQRAYEFVWDEESPVYKMGGWKATKTEFNEIIHNTLTTPRYIWMHIQESLKATAEQLSLFSIGDGNGKFNDGTLLHERVEYHFKGEIKSYENSLQNLDDFTLINLTNKVFYVVIISSTVALFLVLVLRKNLIDLRARLLTLVIIAGVLFNAWDCGTFANAIDRLGCKVMWLIPLLTIILGYSWMSQKSDPKKILKR
jgi:hypothetical protein